MSKILIPPYNTSWGTIVNPMSENIVNHTIGFPTDNPEKSRDKFISLELFNNIDYDWKNSSYWVEKKLVLKNSIEGEILVNLDDYKFKTTYNERVERLLNLDYIIIQENDIYKFFNVASRERINNNTFMLSIEIDDFISNPIQTLIKPSSVTKLDSTTFNIPVWEKEQGDDSNFNYIFKNLLSTENLYNNNTDVKKNIYINREHVRNYFEQPGDMDNVVWVKIHRKLEPNETGTIIYNVTQSFTTYYVPIVKNNWITFSSKSDEIQKPLSLDALINDELVISMDVIPYPPMSFMSGGLEYLNIGHIKDLETPDSPFKNGILLYDHGKQAFKYRYTPDKDMYDYDIAEEFNLKLELPIEPIGYFGKTKDWLEHSNTQIKLLIGGDKFDYNITQLIGNDNKGLKLMLSPYPFKSSYIYIKNLDIKHYLNLPILRNIQDIDLYNLEHSKREKRHNIVDNTYNFIDKITLGIGSMIGDRVFKGTVERDNLKNNPSNVDGETSYVHLFLIKWALQIIIKTPTKERLDNFKMYGMKVNNLFDVSELFQKPQTWEIFTYVKGEEFFNIIDKNLSPERKQNISKYFELGITFWNFSEVQLKKWKGIKNYQDE